jgi:hypothetical protein
MKDATLMATAKPEVLNIYRLVPIAELSDPRWGNSPYQAEVVVEARTSGDARIVAAECELDFMNVNAAPAEVVTTSNASAIRSEKIYTLVEIDRARRDLERSVLEGTVRVDTMKPVHV